MHRSVNGRQLVAGVDSSTQSTKVVVVDCETGRVLARASAPHEVTGRDGARESDPAAWWEALRSAIAQTGLGQVIEAIAIAGQQHGLVVQDAAGVPLRPAILWNDTRSAPDAAVLRDAFTAGWWATRVGVVPVFSFTATKLAMLRRTEPALLAAVHGVRLPHDHLTERLCGEAATDRSDASGTAWWSAVSGSYVDEVLDHPLVALDRALLPRVLGARERAGSVTAAAAAALGLRAGLAVGCGAGDNAAAALGLGAGVGAPVVSLGTSGTIFARSATATVDATGTAAGFADASDAFLPLACTLNATLAIDRFTRWLGIDGEAVEPSGGVVVLPYLDGERTPNLPLASGLVTGLRHDTTQGAILMAAYEGAAASLADALAVIDTDPAAPIVLVGGGARGRAWREVIARLTGRAIVLPSERELAAYGAAAQAAGLVTGDDPVAIARRWQGPHEQVIAASAPDDEALARIRAVRSLAQPMLASE